MKKAFSLMAFCLLFLSCPAAAPAWPGTVVGVSDGDTLIVCRLDGTREKIRLFGVDCPESRARGRWEAQPYSRRAAEFLRDLFRDPARANVAIWEVGDSYGRIVAGVILLHSGATVQEELLKAGLAWVDPRYCKRSIREYKNWMALEQEAARERRGSGSTWTTGKSPWPPGNGARASLTSRTCHMPVFFSPPPRNVYMPYTQNANSGMLYRKLPPCDMFVPPSAPQ